MISSEILIAIDNVSNEQNCAMDDVNKAVLDYYDKQQTVMEYYDELSDDVTPCGEYILEAATDKKDKSGKNILQKIWNAIKQFFKMLAQQFSRLIDRIKNIGKKDGKFVPCDSVVLRILSKSKYNKPDDTSSWSIPKVNPKYTKAEDASLGEEEPKFEKKDSKKKKKKDKVTMEAAQDSRYITVDIPAGKGSTFYPKTVKVPKSDIIAEINNEDKSISFHIVGFGKWNQTEASTEGASMSTAEVEGTKKPWTHSSKISLYLISEPAIFEKFIALTDLATEILFDNKHGHISTFNKKCKKIIDEMDHGARHKKLDKVKVSLKDLTEFQKKVNTLNYKIDKFANISTDVSAFNKDTINSFNLLSKKLLDIQVSMNLLTSALNNNFIVNQCFIGCIKSLALLDQFVAAMIQEGMPPKYIAYNTWLVADECIKGKKEQYKPCWGQTRFIFFPPGGKFVYKIAMSGAGITSNKAEVRTSEMFEKMDRVDLIAPVVKTWEKDAIVVMERVDNDATPSYPEVIAYTKRVNSAIAKYEKDHNLHLNIAIADQHKDNVKYDKVNKCFRSIDYGIANRAYIKPDKKK